jgi:hypothetical protein
MKKLLVLIVLAVVLPLLGLAVLVGAVAGATLDGAGAVGYDAGLTTCLSPPATQPWSASQMQVAALLTSVARKELSGSPRAEQFAVAGSIWQSNLTDLALTSTAASPAGKAGVFAEGLSWGTLAQRTDSLSQAGLFDSKLQGTSWQSGDPWPVIRAVLGLPQPATASAAPVPPVPPVPPVNPTMSELRAYEAQLAIYRHALAAYKVALASWAAKNATIVAATRQRQAHEAQVWSKAGGAVANVTAYWAQQGC